MNNTLRSTQSMRVYTHCMYVCSCLLLLTYFTLLSAEVSKFPKTTLQLRRGNDEDAMLIFVEIWKYGQFCSVEI